MLALQQHLDIWRGVNTTLFD